ncbi:hypothetical protein [Sphaerisporangium aureirubrum]|uniref:Uncharacterized protein n=1 Tax=Sphaerisporangium aureirubrum TaxID=1544736 RepID=A0ABW1NM98_9ACTN
MARNVGHGQRHMQLRQRRIGWAASLVMPPASLGWCRSSSRRPSSEKHFSSVRAPASRSRSSTVSRVRIGT